MNDASICVITSMNFLSCYEVRSTIFMMAWMFEISFILINFHEQIKFLHMFPFRNSLSATCGMQDAGCGMRKCALQKFGLHIFLSAIPFPQLAGSRMWKCCLEKYSFHNSLFATCGMRDAEMTMVNFDFCNFDICNCHSTCGMQNAKCGM